MEKQSVYDRSRKISPLETGFGIPILTSTLESIAQLAPESIQSILKKENITSTMLEPTYSVKEKAQESMMRWCEEGPYWMVE